MSNGYAAPPFNDGPHQLFHNRGNRNHWLEIDLEGTRSNRDAIGTTVYVTADDFTQMREAGGATHGTAQDARRLHFGLGGLEHVDRVEVIWPDGSRQVVEGVDVDQILRVVQDGD